MKQRGISELEVEQIISFPEFTRKYDYVKEAVGRVNNKTLRIVFIENFIKIVTAII